MQTFVPSLPVHSLQKRRHNGSVNPQLGLRVVMQTTINCSLDILYLTQNSIAIKTQIQNLSRQASAHFLRMLKSLQASGTEDKCLIKEQTP
jgi:hypothetical protein